MLRCLQKNLVFAFFLFLGVTAVGQNKPYNAQWVVAPDGSGDFVKIQDAINAVPANSQNRTVIYIRRGLYRNEKLIVPADKKNVTLIGESRDETIISYHLYDCAGPGGKCPTADAALWSGENIRTAATLTVLGDGFRAENLTLQNTAGPVGQAQAITLRGDRNVFINCNFLGYQDTIYFWGAGKRHYFEGCLVLGRTDYIYGDGIAWFEKCEIRSYGGGWITAPSTPLNQPYGYVFNRCRLTYALHSPRGGDDGALVRLGRPWHEYPKVAWMFTDMTDKIHPEGWGDKWNMDYAPTSADLKLLEYKNTGPGAVMTGRAPWTGLRAMTDAEALNYTLVKVLGGADNWDPLAQPPLVRTFTWTGSQANKSWSLAQNWSPAGVPAAGESALADGAYELSAAGAFPADLHLKNGARLQITGNSTVTYLSLAGAELIAAAPVTLAGKVALKEAATLAGTGTLTLSAVLAGTSNLTKTGAGKVVLTGSNPGYAGTWLVQGGTLEANADQALGRGGVTLSAGAALGVGHNGAFSPQAALKVVSGSALILQADVTLTEFYIDNVLQPVGQYSAGSNPNLISGSGKVMVVRPTTFNFVRGTNGNWDVAANFKPQLVPLAGETVLVNSEMETTATVFAANLTLQAAGRLRLRGNHRSTGEIQLQEGSRISYATGGSGFTLQAPVYVAGNAFMEMNSNAASGNALTLTEGIRGSAKVTALNTRAEANVATLVLSGDNRDFTGTWDLTGTPAHAGSTIRMEGTAANAFGAGTVAVGAGNKAIFSHEKAAGDFLKLVLTGTGRAVLNTTVRVNNFTYNNAGQQAGTYTAATHPALFEGTGSLIVASPTGIKKDSKQEVAPVRFYGDMLRVEGGRSAVSVYALTGAVVVRETDDQLISLKGLQPGVYIATYRVNNRSGSFKILIMP